MSAKHRRFAALLVLVLPAAGVSAPVPTPTGPKTPTPEEFVRLFGDAFQASVREERELRRIEIVMPFAAERYQPALRSMRDRFAAEEELGAVLDRRFGPPPRGERTPGRTDRFDSSSPQVSIELAGKQLVTPDRVVVRLLFRNDFKTDGDLPNVRESSHYAEVPYLLVREGGNWRLCLPSASLSMREPRREKRTTAEGKEIEVTVFDAEPVEATAAERLDRKERAEWAARRIRRLTQNVADGLFEDREEPTEAFFRIQGAQFNARSRLLASPDEWPKKLLGAMRRP